VNLESVVDVVSAMRVVTHTLSKFSVRSRGHNPNPGFSSVDKTGVLLDLRNMNTLNVNDGASIVSAGPGVSWGDVYRVLNPLNRSAVGARHADVGVAGSVLGGMIQPTKSLVPLTSY
jgi:FAD/FMN-containing dehydrogenase